MPPRRSNARQRQGVWLALGSALSFGTLGYFIRTGFSQGASLWQLVAWRYLLSTALVGAWLCWRRPRAAPIRYAGMALLLGMTLSAGEVLAFFAAVQRLGAGLPIVILYLFPVLISLVHWRWKGVRPGRAEGLAMLAAFGGTALVSAAAPATMSVVGLGLALSTPLLYAAYILANEALLEKMDAGLLTVWVLAGTGITLAGLGLFLGNGLWPAPQVWPALLGIGLLGTALPVLGLFAAMARIGAARTAFLSTLEPVVGVLIAWLFLGETLSLAQWAGAGMVLGAVGWLQAKGR